MMRTPEDLIADPLYQVNLVLWLLQPSTDRVVSSLLYRGGVRLRAIEQDIPLPVELANKLKSEGIACSDPVSPDFLLVYGEADFFLWECKATMFGGVPTPGGGDSPRRQARSLLIQVPQVLAEGLGLPTGGVASVWVVYMTRHDPSVVQTDGLAQIASALQEHQLKTAPFGLLGLAVEGRTVVLHANYPAHLPASLNAVLIHGKAKVHDLTDVDADPRPLYMIPWMPDIGGADDDYSKAAFGNRVLNAATEVIGPAKPPCELRLEVDGFLSRATLKLYTNWRSRDARRTLRHSVRQLLKEEIAAVAPDLKLVPLEPAGSGWSLTLSDSKTQSRIIEQFRKWKQEHWIVEPPETLFDSLEDD